MIIISGVQGVGKTTLINLLLQERPMLKLSISSTTRPKRPQEGDEEYNFISEEEFKTKEEEGYFMEHVKVNEYRYGTPKKYFTSWTIFNVTASSIENFKSLIKSLGNPKHVCIFISAPFDIIKKRIERRQDRDCIKKKMVFAEEELKYQKHFDYIVLNEGDIKEALKSLLKIVDVYLQAD